MNFGRIRRTLIARGYWDEAGADGGAGGASGGAGNEGSKGDNHPENAKPKGEGDNEGDGKKEEGRKPSDAEAKLLKEVMQKKERIRDLEEQVKKFDGINADEVRALLKERQEQEQRKLEEKGEWEALKKQMADAHQNELKAVREELSTLKSSLTEREQVIERLTVGHHFDASKFIADELTLTPAKARVVYGPHFDVVDGNVVAYDKPRGAKDRAPLVDANGDHLSFEQAIKKLVDADPDRDDLYRAKAKPGANSQTLPGKTPQAKPELRGATKIAAALNTSK
ncbi:DUF6651 domain-containing protein [Ectothiorhodospira shaposhnikovii]|uniref:DUF6651 domain-containing protein n=1 Tax=Ectothiorhodospira shaposhnikovii TaxID=1054 RepID=UPI001EE8C800|nr:DUF6651 domain-containing protein [Ectothiorhodospira shaposhnikovii]MCG5512851.1 hypothetical protein [Ectothiorhodospira shaposhnikovii]